MRERLTIGMDVGSTTVKAVVVEPGTSAFLWSDYQRHHTKQPEKVLELLEAILAAFPDHPRDRWQLFLTGSGATPLAGPTGGRFVQEVNALTRAVEVLQPEANSVVELGGQDAKVVLFKPQPGTTARTVVASMNDKCASGTGATIDKCLLKVGAAATEVASLHFDGTKLHHVAARCGVFAETDVVNLLKSGIPRNEILCSLADAIVQQNLTVLARGNTLRPRVALLGGPNTYLPFLQECWRERLAETWRERGQRWADEAPLDELVFVPPDAALYAAFGAATLGLAGLRAGDDATLRELDALREFITHGRRARLGEKSGPPLSRSAEETRAFIARHKTATFVPQRRAPGATVRAVIGLDGGSTSSKAVLVDEGGELVAKAYRLSEGNPIEDMKALLADLSQQVEQDGASLEVLGFGATGYAADVLEECIHADVNIVETVAHMTSAVHYCGEVDVVCDVGGQDIKVLFLRDGDIAGFKLSNSCSAGNGMLLQAMADQFGLPLTEYADVAFEAELSAQFSYGCAVFLDSDRVTFQKEGYQKQELLAGLAQVLPKNIWQYVVQVPRLASLGTRYVLQGGTQYNLAAVKAQIDYIAARVPGAEVRVHPHPGEAGALGAAMETLRRWKRSGKTRFIGVEAALGLEYTTKNDTETVCGFCANSCKRTYVDTARPDGSTSRYISGFSCEKGAVESRESMLAVVAARKQSAARYPNMLDYEARRAFSHHFEPEPQPPAGAPVRDVTVSRGWLGVRRRPTLRGFLRSSEAAAERRATLRIGMPRALAMFSVAPFLRTYFEALGLQKQNLVFSDATDDELWREGGKHGAIDPCFPSKVALAHVHNLLFRHHDTAAPPEETAGKRKKKRLDYIFFPILTTTPNFVAGVVDSASCPIVAGTPAVVKAAFTKETDLFAERGVEYLAPALPIDEPSLLARRLFETWGERLGVTEDESDHACRQAARALDAFHQDLEARGREILETVEREDRVALLVLGRPYHADPGLNHGIPEEFQALGYPILSIRSLPKDPALLARLFAADLEAGAVATPLQVEHIWPENFSANGAQRVWAASFAAHHPNICVLDLSSFKCGHDAPTYALVESVLSTARTPSAAFQDLDANKPGGSIKIRVKTYEHSLRLQEEQLADLARRRAELSASLAEKRAELLAERALRAGATHDGRAPLAAQAHHAPAPKPKAHEEVALDALAFVEGRDRLVQLRKKSTERDSLTTAAE